MTSIIDGTGSVGAALGPLLAGAIPDFKNVFYMLMAADVLALLVRNAQKKYLPNCCPTNITSVHLVMLGYPNATEDVKNSEEKKRTLRAT